MAYLSADPFPGGHILSLKRCYFNPSTDMAPLARCLDHTEPSIVALTDAYQPNQTTGLCVYGIVDSFKDILVIIYSINYRI